MPYFGKTRKDYDAICPNATNKKTLDDIYRFNERFAESVRAWLATSSEALPSLLVKERFPFLQKTQCELVAKYEQQYGFVPFFYVAAQHVLADDSRNALLFRMAYGVGQEAPTPLLEIAQKISLSRERVRQIVSDFHLPESISFDETKQVRYADLLACDCITPQTPAYLAVKENERLPDDFRLFASIFTLVSDFIIKEGDNGCVLIGGDAATKGEKGICAHRTFNQNMQRFRAFVETYHRYPFRNGGSEEQSLFVWLCAVKYASAYNEQQSSALERTEQEYAVLGYPRNGREERFVERCEEMKNHVLSHHQLPKKRDAFGLHLWYAHARRDAASFTGCRAMHFAALRAFLRDMGFE